MEKEKKPIELAQEAVKNVRCKFKKAVVQAQETIEQINVQDRIDRLKLELGDFDFGDLEKPKSGV